MPNTLNISIYTIGIAHLCIYSISLTMRQVKDVPLEWTSAIIWFWFRYKQFMCTIHIFIKTNSINPLLLLIGKLQQFIVEESGTHLFLGTSSVFLYRFSQHDSLIFGHQLECTQISKFLSPFNVVCKIQNFFFLQFLLTSA